MTDDDRLSYEELQRRLADAESAIEALRQHEVDAVVGEDEIAYVRLRQMEEALRAKTQQLSDVLESIRDAFLAVDNEWKITYINEHAAALAGSSADEVVGRDLWKSFAALAECSVQDLARTVSDLNEPRHKTVKLDDRWLSVSIYPATEGLSIYWRDITQQKRVERRRETQRELLEALVENASVGIAVIGEDRRYHMVNPAYAAFPGLDKKPVAGALLEDVLPEEMLETALHMLQTTLQYGRATSIREYEVPGRGTATSSYLNIEYVPLAESDGPAETVLVLTYDVSDVVRARKDVERLARQRERNLSQLQAVLSNIDQGLLIFDPGGTILMVNRAARAYLAERGQPIPQTIEQIAEMYSLVDCCGEPISADELPTQRVLRGDRFSGTTIRAIPSDSDEEMIYDVGGAPIYDDEGNLILGIITINDITERVATARQLRALNQNLESEVAERTRMAENRANLIQSLANDLLEAEQRERTRLSHLLHDNLQQMLTAAQMRAQMLSGQMYNAGSRNALGELIDMLEEAIQESRSLATELSPPVLSHGLAPATRWLAEQMHDKHRLKVSATIGENVEPGSEELAGFLLQAMRELLFNVVKHADVEEADVHLTRQEEHLCIRVEDDGVGFDASDVAASEQPAEAGAGLPNIRRRLEVLGGTLEIDSSPGEGAVFTLQVPVIHRDAQAHVEPEQESDIPAQAAAERDVDGRVRTMIVDDHDVVRGGLAELLDDYPDIEVVGDACDGATAVRLARELQPDAIVMDVSMPGMTGIEATRRIVAENPGIRVIGLSMHEERDVARQMIDAGAEAFVTKGGPYEALISAIRGRDLLNEEE